MTDVATVYGPLVYHSVVTKQRICVCDFCWACTPLFGVHEHNNIKFKVMRLTHTVSKMCVNWLIGKVACSVSIASIVIPAFNYTF